MIADMKLVKEFEDGKGTRYRKVTHADAKAYVNAVHKTYEAAPDRLSFGDFVPVGDKPMVAGREPKPAT